LDKHSLLSPAQHGFRHSRATITNLLHSMNSWTESLERKSPVNILYVDFAKAFDCVSIPKLIFKLDRYGIKRALLNTIESFLINRFQKVKVGKYLSDKLKLSSGVPYGKVFGAILVPYLYK